MKKKILIGVIFVFLIIIGVALFLYYQNSNSKPPVWGVAEIKSNGKLECSGNACFVEDGKVIPKNIDKKTMERLNYHCSDPRNCPPPSSEQINKSVASIREYEKNSSLLVAPITTNPTLGYFVFCTKPVNGQCWAVDSKTSEVVGKVENSK